MDIQELEALIQKYNAGICSPEEKLWLEQWYQMFDWNNPPAGMSDADLERLKEYAWFDLKHKLSANAPARVVKGDFPSGKRPAVWRYYAAAAVIALLAGMAVYQYYFNTPVIPSAPVTEIKSVVPDVSPGVSKAQLTLADGRIVSLDSASAPLRENDGTEIDQQSGKLIYNSSSASVEEVLFNTLSVPRGGEYQLAMADGTKVWLNAASSLRFPTRFIGKERLVYLSGEGYFEVAKNAKMPFRVITEGDMIIEALGTKFDIMAYNDEKEVKTALAEGAVRVSKQSDTVLLSPSKMAAWQKNNRRFSLDEADMEKVLAWKNGMIEFREDDLPSIMRQISRWYDIDISYKGGEPKGRYNGSIRRQSKLSLVLEILKEAGVECTLSGKKLMVEEG